MMANAPGGIYRIRNLSARICGVLCQQHADDANPDGVCWQGDYQGVICMTFPTYTSFMKLKGLLPAH